MKNLLLSLVGFLLTANLFAQATPQKADTVFGYGWVGEAWKLTSRSFNTYNEGCQSESQTFQDLVNGLWINTGKILYTYDANSRVSVETNQSWDTISSSFENSYRDTFTYNASGNIMHVLQERWDGSAWQNEFRGIYTYDGSGYLISYFEESWFGGSWGNNILGTYTNNSDGTPHIVVSKAWNRATAAWENNWRGTYTYNGAGKVLTGLEELWRGASWVNNTRRTYTYSGNNLTNELTEYTNSDGSWVNDHQATYTYNGDGTVSQSIYQQWNGGIWVNAARQDNVYTTACALPLTLLNFTGTKNNNSVLLTWKTANEINTSHFAVQRSLDAIDFTDIKIVSATPGSVSKTYSFTDNVAGIKASKIYYRLKMVDKDGKFEMSKIVPVTLVNYGQRFTIRPNPAKDYFVISPDAAALSDALVNITDFSGRSVFKQRITLSGEQKIDISTLPKGVYMVTINTGDNTITQKLMIK